MPFFLDLAFSESILTHISRILQVKINKAIQCFFGGQVFSLRSDMAIDPWGMPTSHSMPRFSGTEEY